MSKKAEIERTDALDHPARERANFNLILAGTNLAPWGYEHQGSAVVHFYHKKGTNDFAFVCQTTGLDSIPEEQADAGHKELQRTLMQVYGRGVAKRGIT